LLAEGHGLRVWSVVLLVPLLVIGAQTNEGTGMRCSLLAAEIFAEKEFYLDEFHEKSLIFALRAADWIAEPERPAVVEVLTTLLRNDTRMVLLLEMGRGAVEQRRVTALAHHLARGGHTLLAEPVELVREEESVEQRCMQLWEVLRTSRLAVGLWSKDAPVGLARCAQQVAVGLRVYKLVYLDPCGGLVRDGKRLSSLTEPGLQDLLRAEHTETAGLAARRPVLEAIHAALVGGVTSVSLCPLAGVGQELFTYEGSGTLFTRAEYCQIEKLGIDDFHEVERLLQRAAQAGYLKPRTPYEMARLLLHGYGARLGPDSMEPAGFCALLPYPDDRAAELTGLFTITRYQGEGVGGRLVESLVQEAQRQGLTYVFAVTTQAGAQRLFIRHGFQRVPPEAVAAVKWHGYDPARRDQVTVYRRDLAPTQC
jgi:N-acetylglutamate synthase-like GNAT family acetyltransferase